MIPPTAPLYGALAVWAAALAWVLVLDDPRLRFGAFAPAMALASAAWLYLCARPKALDRRLVILAVVLAIAARVAFLASSPAFSDDVFRYIYEGRVVWWMGPTFTYTAAPMDGPALGVPTHLIDAAWYRVNNSGLRTIYPPGAQLAFAFAGGLGELIGRGHLFILKTVLVLAELAACALLGLALRATGRPATPAIVLALCPLLILETAREGHADSLAMLGLALGVRGFVAARPTMGYAGWALAALTKLNGLVVLPAAIRATRKGWPAALLVALLAAPYLLGGPDAAEGLTAYATRWRAGDGAFSLLLALSETLLGGDWRRFGAVTIERDELARGLSLLLFAGAMWAVLKRRYAVREVPARGGLLLLLLLLLSPTLHPWYALWLIPFIPFATHGRSAMLALVALAWLGHHAVWLELVLGVWTDVAWVRAAVHLPVWTLLLVDLVRHRRSG